MRLALPFLAMLLLATALPHAAAAADGPGVTAVKKANETVTTLLKRKPPAGSPEEKKLAAEVTTKLRGFLDIEELGRRALADHWAKLTPAQRTEYMSLLRALIEANYVRGLRANLDYQVKYLGEKDNGGSLVVSTEVRAQRRGRPYTIAVDYVLRRNGTSWKTFDVVTDGVGLVENYRAQFNKIIAKDGFAGLLDRMRKKKAQM
jgi:phospholipid transport system substrate-binding protein